MHTSLPDNYRNTPYPIQQQMPAYWPGYMQPFQAAPQQPLVPLPPVQDPPLYFPSSGMQQGQAFPPIMPPAPPGAQGMNPYPKFKNGTVNPFENPLQPLKAQMSQAQGSNPYPIQGIKPKNQSSGIQSMLNQFKTQDGSIDINKMMSTAGQMMNTFSQVSSMVKGVGSIFLPKV